MARVISHAAVAHREQRSGVVTCGAAGMARKSMCPVLLSLVLAVSIGARAASPQSAAASIKAGTGIAAQLNNNVGTKTSHVGEKVEATLGRRPGREVAALLPKGCRLRGAIVEVRSADRKSKVAARLRIEFNEIILPDGRTIPAKLSTQEGWGYIRPMGIGPFASMVTFSALAGAGVGGLARGRRGAVIGAAIGGVAGGLVTALTVMSRWRDIQHRKGWDIFVHFDQDFTLPPPAPAKP